MKLMKVEEFYEDGKMDNRTAYINPDRILFAQTAGHGGRDDGRLFRIIFKEGEVIVTEKEMHRIFKQMEWQLRLFREE